MAAPVLTLHKFSLLLRYLDALGLDSRGVASDAGLSKDDIELGDPETTVPAIHYSRLYKQAVLAMQRLDPHVPWGAGLGTDAFEMLCRAIIGCGTLEEALDRAERFSSVLEPVTGNCVSLVKNKHEVELHFHWNAEEKVANVFAPKHWPRSNGARSVTLASGLLIWHGLMSWLTGHAIKVERVMVADKSVGESYAEAMGLALAVRPQFGADRTCLVFPRNMLDYRVVQNHESLQSFLEETVLQLIKVEQRPASTGEAVKRLLGNDFSSGMPTFAEVADRLHTSESSLRRRLLDEETSFQALKDEVRCELAMNYLSEPDARLGDIAERLGFTEQSSFGRSFRQWTGMTPKAWRDWSMKQHFRQIG